VSFQKRPLPPRHTYRDAEQMAMCQSECCVGSPSGTQRGSGTANVQQPKHRCCPIGGGEERQRIGE